MITVHEGHVVANKYRLLRPLAKGGMGSVWAAEHVTLDMQVAVKFMIPQLVDEEGLRARFEREAKAAAQLRSPNVVQIYDYGLDGDAPYIAMELLKGEDLGARLARDGRLGLADALPIFNQIGKALRRAHEERIVHRDLKPVNIFLARHDDEILVKVLDFGIAKLLGPNVADGVTKTGTVMGSPHYMSPEQVRGLKELDHRTDIWALGVILYRTLTGQLPFPGSQMGDIFLKICTARPTPPSELVSDCDPRHDSLIDKALAVDPAARFQSVKEMMDALNALAAAARPSVSAPTPSPETEAAPANTSSDQSLHSPPSMTAPLSPLTDLLVRLPLPSAPVGATSQPEEIITNTPVTQQIERGLHDPSGQNAPVAGSPAAPRTKKPWIGWRLTVGLGLVIAAGIFLGRERIFAPRAAETGSSDQVGTQATLAPAEPVAEVTSVGPAVFPTPIEPTSAGPAAPTAVSGAAKPKTGAPVAEKGRTPVSPAGTPASTGSAAAPPSTAAPAPAPVKKSSRFGF